MRRFYLHTRKNGIFYAELVDPATGRKMSAKSTGTASRDEALLVVARWLSDGVPTGRLRRRRPLELAFNLESILELIRKTDLTPEDAERIVKALQSRDLVTFSVVKRGPASEPLLTFLARFWNYDESPYVREKLQLGQRIGRNHCYQMESRLAHWKDSFEGRILADVTRQELKAFAAGLAEKSLAPSTRNLIVRAGTTALRWAFENDIIPADPTIGMMHFAGPSAERGILTPAEASKLFSLTWSDERARIGNLLSATTGLRAGEVLALRRQDIGLDRIHVRHSWCTQEGLKSTKTGKERTVPLVSSVRRELLALLDRNPFGESPEAFLFYSDSPARPMDGKTLLRGLQDALIKFSIGTEDDPKRRKEALSAWKARGVCFHSWRHYYARQIADRVDIRTAKLGTGHATDAMLEHYANHRLEEDFSRLAAASGDAFGQILTFPEGTK